MTNQPNGTSVPSGDRASEHFLHVFYPEFSRRIPSLLRSALARFSRGWQTSFPESCRFLVVNVKACRKAAVKYVRKQTNR